MTEVEALDIVLELADQNLLPGGIIDNDGPLMRQRLMQEEAVSIVAGMLERLKSLLV